MRINFADVENVLYRELIHFIQSELKSGMNGELPESLIFTKEWYKDTLEKLQNAYDEFEGIGYEEFLDYVDQNHDEFGLDIAEYLEDFRCSGQPLGTLGGKTRESNCCYGGINYYGVEVGIPIAGYPNGFLCWTHWHGWGHGEPAAIPWIDNAYIKEISSSEILASIADKTREIQELLVILEMLK